jgi:XisH protein
LVNIAKISGKIPYLCAMARDIYHETVKLALISDEWHITHDPYVINLGGRDSVEADLGAEKMLQAERMGRKIVVEIKSFLNRSLIYDFHVAYGQFAFYRRALQKFEHGRELYLAMPIDIFEELLIKPYFKEFMETEMNIVVFDPIQKKIVQWIN